MNIKTVLLFTLTVCLLSLSGCNYNRSEVGDAETQPAARGKKVSKEIVLVPLGDFPDSKVQELVNYYREKFNLKVKTVPPLKINPAVIDPKRRQMVAEDALEMMQWGYPRLSGDPRAVMIGLTNVDMYIRRSDWQFTFSWRQYERFAIVSDARMSLGTPPVSEDKINARLRKMVTKNIGIMYYDLEQSEDPRSVLYRYIGGLEELDYMGEEF